jgi:hypothetical protein
MAKTIAQINEKIKAGSVVVVTAEEFTAMARTKEPGQLAQEVDVVTTATFGPMCSSGAVINFGHWNPGIRMEDITLNDVPVYQGLAAVDGYIGATAESKYDCQYGGAHVIEDLIAGKELRLHARGKGTDCYPTKEIDTYINKDVVNEFYLFDPRNAYQNYGAATNSTSKIKYTYMGCLLPSFGNVTYSTSGELSPLLNDPYLRTIGLGTRIFLGGTRAMSSGTARSSIPQRNGTATAFRWEAVRRWRSSAMQKRCPRNSSGPLTMRNTECRCSSGSGFPFLFWTMTWLVASQFRTARSRRMYSTTAWMGTLRSEKSIMPSFRAKDRTEREKKSRPLRFPA